jgi:hypothetical protein
MAAARSVAHKEPDDPSAIANVVAATSAFGTLVIVVMSPVSYLERDANAASFAAHRVHLSMWDCRTTSSPLADNLS